MNQYSMRMQAHNRDFFNAMDLNEETSFMTTETSFMYPHNVTNTCLEGEKVDGILPSRIKMHICHHD